MPGNAIAKIPYQSRACLYAGGPNWFHDSALPLCFTFTRNRSCVSTTLITAVVVSFVNS
jgi:hypothetical protein